MTISGFHWDLIVVGVILLLLSPTVLWRVGRGVGRRVLAVVDWLLAGPEEDLPGYVPVPVEEWPPTALERLQRDVLAMSEDDAEDRLVAATEALEREHHIARHLRAIPSLAERQERQAVADLSAWRRQRAQAVSQRPPVDGGAA